MAAKFDDFGTKIDNVLSELKIINLENDKIIFENKRLSEEILIGTKIQS